MRSHLVWGILKGKPFASFRTTPTGAMTFSALRESLKKRYKNIKFVEYSTFGNFRDPRKYGAELEKYAGLRDLLLSHKCDAVVVGMGA